MSLPISVNYSTVDANGVPILVNGGVANGQNVASYLQKLGESVSSESGEIITALGIQNKYFTDYMSKDPQIRKDFYCKIGKTCGITDWISTYMGMGTFCASTYSNRYFYENWDLISVRTATSVAATPALGTGAAVPFTLPISPSNDIAHALPQEGNTVVLNGGVLATVIAVNGLGTATPTLTLSVVQGKDVQPAFTVAANQNLKVLTGKTLLPGECPEPGQFKFDQSYELRTFEMQRFSTSSPVIDADSSNTCYNLFVKYHVAGDGGCLVPVYNFIGGALNQMYRDHETLKDYQIMFNPVFGVIPQLKKQALRWNLADPNAVSITDFEYFKKMIIARGIDCREYGIWAASDLYCKFENFFNDLAKANNHGVCFEMGKCKEIDLTYCKATICGVTFHLYEECSFSDPRGLGQFGMGFDNKALIIPMCPMTPQCSPINEDYKGTMGNKMINIIYREYKDANIVWNSRQDGVGYINGKTGAIGPNCMQDVYNVISEFVVEVNCAHYFGLMNWEA